MRESQRIGRHNEKDSSDGRKDRLGTGVREADEEIQPGGYSGRFDRPDGMFVRLVFLSAINNGSSLAA